MIYKFDDFTLDTNNFSVSKLDQPVSLEPQVFDLLSYLVRNNNKMLSRDQLFDQVWPGKVISDTTLSGHIKSVRKVLGDSGQNQHYIKTIHGRGYQFVATVSEATVKSHQNLTDEVNDSGCYSHKGQLVTVLPFQDMNLNPEQQFFAEGMSEDITTELSRFSDIQVVSSHSAFQLKNVAGVADYFRERRSMNYIVEGKVRRSSDRIRLNIQLIDVATNHTVWAEQTQTSAHMTIYSAACQRTKTVTPAKTILTLLAENLAKPLSLIQPLREPVLGSLVRHAMFLNPLHPGWYFQELGVVYYSMDKFDTAIVTFERNWELGPYDLAFIAACQVANNQMAEAKANCARALELEPNSSIKLFSQFENYQDINKSQQLCDRMIKAGFPA